MFGMRKMHNKNLMGSTSFPHEQLCFKISFRATTHFVFTAKPKPLTSMTHLILQIYFNEIVYIEHIAWRQNHGNVTINF